MRNIYKIGRSFIEEIKEGEKVAVVHDKDVDGIVSAVLFARSVEFPVFLIPFSWKDETIENEIIEFDIIVTLDLANDVVKKFLPSGRKTLVIDHHPIRESINAIIVNPRLVKQDSYKPTSYIVYKMFEEKISNLKWLAEIGIIADKGVEECKDVVEVKGEVWKSRKGTGAKMIAASSVIIGVTETVEKLLSFERLDDLLHDEEMRSSLKKYEKEIEKCEKEFWKNCMEIENAVVGIISPEYEGVGSVLSTKLAEKSKGKIIMVITDGNPMRVHGRCNGCDINIGEMLREICGGGGHERAGGGNIKDFDSFVKKIAYYLHRKSRKLGPGKRI